jgi:hypothetical protein
LTGARIVDKYYGQYKVEFWFRTTQEEHSDTVESLRLSIVNDFGKLIGEELQYKVHASRGDLSQGRPT